MNELETMQRAKMYLDKLSQGTDPITEQPLPPGDCLHNPRLSRCLQYVSGILEKLIQNEGQIVPTEKASFAFTPEVLAKVQLSGDPLRIADFVDRILRATNYEGMKQLSPVKLTNWLVKNGFLAQESGPDGKQHRIPTPAGEKLGISAKMCECKDGEFLGIFYDTNAQRFLLDHIPSITAA